ncbi:MAG: glycoside hydrolase family 5 protein [Eggerthellaceae bacterium]|nr:glycoside hydrolase family 5 protein [Eggerthellaceae bacterium]
MAGKSNEQIGSPCRIAAFSLYTLLAKRLDGEDVTMAEGNSKATATLLVAVLGAVLMACALGGCAGSSSGSSVASGSGSATAGSAGAASAPATSGSSVAAPSTGGALHVEGTRLVGKDGRAVQLRGASTHGLAWFPTYVNDALFGELRIDWGANVVRLALYTAESGGYCTDGDKAQLRKLVDDGVRYATDNGLYVIIDWHILSDNDPNMHADEAEAFFRDVSAAYADHGNVLYEICNEPNGGTSWADVKAYAERIIPVIRENSPDAVVIVGTPTWSQDVDAAAADPLAFDNVMYALHFYAATHKDDLRAKAAAALDAGLPLFVTEFGICDASGNGAIDEEQADAWIAFLDERGVSYVMWNLSNKAESSAAFKPTCSKVSGFDDADLSQSGAWLKRTLSQRFGTSGA